MLCTCLHTMPFFRHTDSLCRTVWGINKYDPNVPLKIGSILRISHKYQLNCRRTPWRNLFVSAWPQSLKDWDDTEQRFESMTANHTSKQIAAGVYTEDHFPESASAIRLARDVDIPDILPAAFYHLSR